MFSNAHTAFALVCLLMSSCLITAQRNTDGTKLCEPLVRYKIDCNTCYCSVDGQRYTCTKRVCTSDIASNNNDLDENEAKTSEEKDERLNEILHDLDKNDNNNDKIFFPKEGEYGY